MAASARTAPTQGLDAKSTGRETAIVRLGHKSGFGIQTGAAGTARPRSGTFCAGKSAGGQIGGLVSAEFARENQRSVAALSG